MTDGHEATKGHTGGESRKVLEDVIVSDRRVGHDDDVVADVDVGGDGDVGQQDAAVSYPGPVWDVHAGVDHSGIPLVRDAERGQATNEVLASRALSGADQQQRRRVRLHLFEAAEDSHPTHVGTPARRVLIKQAEHAMRRRRPQDRENLPSKPAGPDEKEL